MTSFDSRDALPRRWLLHSDRSDTVGKILHRIAIKMLTFKVSLFCLLLKFGLTEEMFTIYQGKSLKETARAFEIAIKPINSSNHRHCAMQCNFEPQCLAAFFEGEWSLCRLYSNINGATTGGEGDFSMVKREFGVCEFVFIFLY